MQNKRANACAFIIIAVSLHQKKKQKQLNPKTRKGKEIMKRMRKIYGKGARVWFYCYITSNLTEIYDENKKYMFDVRNLNEFKEIYC